MQTIDKQTVQSLRHVLLKARGPGRGTEEDYDKAYSFWLEMWRSTFSEVQADINLQSDMFLTQREVSAIFMGDQVVALQMFDFRDLRLKAHRDLSYFRHFPSEVLKLLLDQGYEQVMSLGQMTVHPDWRRNKVGPFMSEVLAGIAINRFLSTSAAVMVAITRNDRSTQELGYRFGAVPLRRGHEAYGIPSDVIVIQRDKAKGTEMAGMATIIDRLWRESRVARLFSDLPPALNRNTADNDLDVVLVNESRIAHTR
ncbi:MAG: hypothetical protein QM778_27185 [Myxococcales bacterium]